MSESLQEFQARTGASVEIGQRWQHRKNLRVVVVVGFTNDGWTVHYRTADDPKSKRLSVSAICSFVYAYQRHPCVACGSLLHATSDCAENLAAMAGSLAQGGRMPDAAGKDELKATDDLK